MANSEDRYPGHDPHLGHRPATLRLELVQSLLASGRYRRYVEHPDAEELWAVLESTGALEPELMRWYAIRRAAETTGARNYTI